MQPGAALLDALQQGSFAAAMRNSIWLYPAVQTLHIIGFVILVGAVIMFDLRVLGVSKRVPVRLLAQYLLPWAVAALLLIVPAGFLMFSADATGLIYNRAFVIKMVLLMLAATNAAALSPTSELARRPAIQALTQRSQRRVRKDAKENLDENIMCILFMDSTFF